MNMRTRQCSALAAAFALAATLLSGCYVRIPEKVIEDLKEKIAATPGTPKSQTFCFGSCRNIHILNDWDKEYVQTDGDSVRVVIVTSDVVLDHVRVEQNGTDLLIGYDLKLSRFRAAEHKVTVYGPLPDSLFLRGSGDAHLSSVTGDSLYISAVGSGDVILEIVKLGGKLTLVKEGSGDLSLPLVDAGTLVLEKNGSGDTYLAGNVRKAQFSKQGSGDLDAGRLNAKEAKVLEVSGSGSFRYNLNGETIDTDED